MELYHASKQIVQYPEVRKAKYTKDFSWGFYCTNNIQQAIRWANRGAGDPVINYYEYEPNDSLKILKFPEMSDEWLDFIAQCRSHQISFHTLSALDCLTYKKSEVVYDRKRKKLLFLCLFIDRIYSMGNQES